MFAILGCLDKKSFINLCMKFSRYYSLRYAKPIAFRAMAFMRCHFTLRKKCFMTFCHFALYNAL